MGVKSVMRWVNIDAVNRDHPRAVLIVLKKTLESLDGRSFGKWKLTCSALKAKVEAKSGKVAHIGSKDLFLVAFTDHPAKSYLLMRQERLVLEADKSVRSLLEKMSVYGTKYTMEFDGSVYNLGDFNVKLGRAQTQSEEYKGIIVEVEYRPVSNLEIGQPILKEFISVLHQAIATHQADSLAKGGRTNPAERCMGKLEVVAAPLAEYPMPPEFGFQHSAAQYVAVCSALLAQTAPAQT